MITTNVTKAKIDERYAAAVLCVCVCVCVEGIYYKIIESPELVDWNPALNLFGLRISCSRVST